MRSSSDRRVMRGPRATVLGAFLEGWRRVLRAPAVVVSLFALSLVVAVPFGALVASGLESQLGASATAERLMRGWDPDWADEVASEASGLLATFTHEILGFGGTLATLSRLLDAEPLPAGIVAPVAAYAAIWLFLTGGLLDRFARARPLRPRQFFAACGTHFFRLLRQAIVVLACYWLAFAYLHPLLFDRIYGWAIRDMAEERDVVAVRALLYAGFLAVLAAINLVADFAKVRTVVEDRRSALATLAASLRFVRRRFWRVAGLYVINILALLVILRLWLQMAPAASAATWVVLLAGQIYILARIWARLAFLASEVVFFQGELAHAEYAAPLEPLWPDSPAVEALEHLRR